jgi:hypothetical protein
VVRRFYNNKGLIFLLCVEIQASRIQKLEAMGVKKGTRSTTEYKYENLKSTTKLSVGDRHGKLVVEGEIDGSL